jgi:hypothetical protein
MWYVVPAVPVNASVVVACPTVVSVFTAVPVYTANNGVKYVLAELTALSVYNCVAVGVNEYHTDAFWPATGVGSPLSTVAPMLSPETDPLVPVITTAAEKLSLLGGAVVQFNAYAPDAADAPES